MNNGFLNIGQEGVDKPLIFNMFTYFFDHFTLKLNHRALDLLVTFRKIPEGSLGIMDVVFKGNFMLKPTPATFIYMFCLICPE